MHRYRLLLGAGVLVLLLWPVVAWAQVNIKWEQTPGPLGGPIKALAVDPRHGKILYAGTLTGVFKSTDGGKSWRPLNQGILACKEINVLQVDPLGQRIYAGGREGLYRSEDGGQTWRQIGAGLPSDLVLALAICPSQSNILCVSMGRGVYLSEDYGDHWRNISQGLPGKPWSLAFSSVDPYTIYAGGDGWVYFWVSAKEGWRSLSEGLPSGGQVKALMVDPFSPNGLFAATNEGLYRLRSHELHWVAVPFGTATAQVSFLSFSPELQQKGVFYTNARLKELWRSLDGGETWQSLPFPDRVTSISQVIPSPDDPLRLYAATREGFYLSEDGGANWQPHNEGLIASDVHALVDVPGTLGRIYAATTMGVFRLEGARRWVSQSRGLSDMNVSSLAVDPRTHAFLYAATRKGGIYRSEDGGKSWVLTSFLKGGGEEGIKYLCVGYPDEDGKDLPIVYAGAEEGGVWRSLDRGETWEQISTGLPESGFSIGAMWCPPTKNGGYLYVGAGRGVYRLPINTASAESLRWEALESSFDGQVAALVPDPQEPETLYLATTLGKVYQSKDQGQSWELLSSQALPTGTEVQAFAVLPTRNKRAPLFCAFTAGGLFLSADMGESWFLGGTGCLQSAREFSVVLDDKDPGTIYVGIQGGGVYKGQLTQKGLLGWQWYLAGILVLIVGGGAIFWRQLHWRSVLHRRELFEQNWPLWNEAIERALLIHRRVTPDLLDIIPEQERVLAMRRYLDTHRDQELVFYEDPPTIEPVRLLALERFVEDWKTLVQQLGRPEGAASQAMRITEQLCELLGFSPIESRVFKSLLGYMVKAPTVRLSIPSRFPFIFVLKDKVDEDDVRDIRDLMRVLNATSFFALLLVPNQDPQARENTRRLRRLVQGGAEDFIVLDDQDLASLYLASDAARRLVELILAQVDLTVVSPYVVSGPVPENMFFGRDYELKAIMRTVRDRSFAIVGGRKIGKTSVLNKVARLMEQTSSFAPYYLDCQHLTTYAHFFDALKLKYQVRITSEEPDAMRHVIVHLRRHRPEALIVLLLDEIDALLAFDAEQQMHLFRVFRALSQEGLCRFVFCGERGLNDALRDPDSPLFNFCNTMRLSYLLPQDALRIVVEPMAEMGISFEDPKELPEQIVELSSCHPNIVQAICRMLIERLNARRERIIRTSDLEAVRGSSEFHDFFFSVIWGNATTLERLITVLMVSQESFTLKEIRQALLAHGCRVGTLELSRALDDLLLFSILQKQNSHYSFAARSFPKLMMEAGLVESFLESLLEEYRLQESKD